MMGRWLAKVMAECRFVRFNYKNSIVTALHSVHAVMRIKLPISRTE